MHILLVRFSSMGDVVLQTATVNWLRSLLGPRLRITFLTSREFASLLEGHPGIDHVLTFDRRKESWKELMLKLRLHHRERPVDLILDLHATLRSLRLRLSLWFIPSLTVDKRRWERFLLTKIKSVTVRRFLGNRFFPLEPQTERILKDFETIFQDTRSVRRTQDQRRGANGELTSLGQLPEYPLPSPYIVLAPGASFAPKRWHVDSFVQLARDLLNETQHHVVILAGSEDEFCRAFDEIKDERLHNLQGKTSLRESMSVLARAALCVGNDSGMNHIAEAHAVPCVTVFGPTDPRFGFLPHGKSSAFLSQDLWCKPCSTTGSSPCYRKRHYCMELITVGAVKEKALQGLKGGHE